MNCPKCDYHFESIEWGFGQVQCPRCLQITDLNEVGIDKWTESNIESTKLECQPNTIHSEKKTKVTNQNNYEFYEDGCP